MASRHFVTSRGEFDISYILDGDRAAPNALFLHGWGANKELMKSSFAAHPFHALFLDLPGFGASANSAVLSTADYAVIVAEVLRELDFQPQVIIAHSFGGKIAALLDPPLLVLLSSAGIPKRKTLAVRVKIALAKRLKFVVSNTLRDLFRTKDASGLNDTMYETLKRVVDEDFSAVFAARAKPTLIFWGRKDAAMPLYYGERIHALITGSRFVVFGGDHFFFAQHAKAILGAISTELAGE